MTSPSEILSQDEVDALLKGVNGDAEEPAEVEQDASGVRPYDLANPERTVRGRMPTLEIINDRFTRLVRLGLTNFMRRSPDVTTGPVKVQKFGEFTRNLVVPTNLNVVQIKSLRGTGLIVFEPNLVFSVVDNLFGGDGRYHVRIEGRDFTPTERRIIERLLEVVIHEYQNAWAPVHALELEFVRSEMNTQFANIASAGELVVTSSFAVELGNAGGNIHICLPYAALEPLRDVLANVRTGAEAEIDQRWMHMLTRQVQLAEVQLTAPLANVKFKIGDLMKLKAGDVISVDLNETVMAEVEGVPILQCRYGTSAGKYALKVDRVMPVSNNDLSPSNGE